MQQRWNICLLPCPPAAKLAGVTRTPAGSRHGPRTRHGTLEQMVET